MPTVFCENINRKITVSETGLNLKDILLDEGVQIYSWPRQYWPLNGCRSDLIEVTSGIENLSPMTGKERAILRYAQDNHRLAGQCTVQGDVTIRIRP